MKRAGDGHPFARHAVKLDDVSLQAVDLVAIDQNVVGTACYADARTFGRAFVVQQVLGATVRVGDHPGKCLRWDRFARSGGNPGWSDGIEQGRTRHYEGKGKRGDRGICRAIQDESNPGWPRLFHNSPRGAQEMNRNSVAMIALSFRISVSTCRSDILLGCP